MTTSTPSSNTTDKDIPNLPLSHYNYGHLRFPEGDNIPCIVHDAQITCEDKQPVKLVVTVKYGPFVKREIVAENLMEFTIRAKYLNVEYTVDDSYALAKLFEHYNLHPPQVRYPDFNPTTESEEIEFLQYFEDVFKNFFIPHKYTVYVDTEGIKIMQKGLRKTYTELISKLKIVKQK